jgi:hypothetical protein
VLEKADYPVLDFEVRFRLEVSYEERYDGDRRFHESY